MAKRGRPPKPPGEVKSVLTSIRLSEDEHELLGELAKKSGVKRTEFIRLMLVGSAIGNRARPACSDMATAAEWMHQQLQVCWDIYDDDLPFEELVPEGVLLFYEWLSGKKWEPDKVGRR